MTDERDEEKEVHVKCQEMRGIVIFTPLGGEIDARLRCE